jgi:transcriptional regulator with PAS, ATPase and Fis domain
LNSFLKRSARFWLRDFPKNGRYYNHEKVKNLSSILLYLKTPPRTIIWTDSETTVEQREFVEGLTEKAGKRMQDYVDAKKMKTDRPACPVFKVNIESMLDMMMKDGAQSFEDWTDLAFKLHGEGSVERSTLKRIMGHPQADRLVRAANAYLKKHVLNLTWRQSMEYQEQALKQRETEGMYMTVTESKNWIRRIAKFNNISMNSLYENVNIVMSKAKPKINTIFLEGESNAGKSKLARSITDGFLTCGQTTRSETFMFQDLPD